LGKQSDASRNNTTRAVNNPGLNRICRHCCKSRTSGSQPPCRGAIWLGVFRSCRKTRAATSRSRWKKSWRWGGIRIEDDVVIRIVADGTGSKLDIRSMSRVGKSDLGKNATRIRDFLAKNPTRLSTGPNHETATASGVKPASFSAK
jgi:hypothetical protein